MKTGKSRGLLALGLTLALLAGLAPVCAAAEGLTPSAAPMTGDENNIVLWIVILAVALVAIGVLVWSLLRRGKKAQEQEPDGQK